MMGTNEHKEIRAPKATPARAEIKTLSQVAGEARKLGLTYGKYMALVQSGGLEEYIRNRRRENG